MTHQIIVAGATGFIGGHLISQLIENGWLVIALIRENSDTSRLPLDSDRLKLENLSGMNAASLRETMAGCVACINASTAYQRSEGKNSEVWATNFDFASFLLEAALDVMCPIFLQFDSFFTKNVLIHECQPQYTESKRAFLKHARERLSRLHCRTTFFNMRLEHVYGPGDSKDKFVPWVINQLTENTHIINLSDGTQKRDFVYVGDVASAVLLVLKNTKPVPGEVISFEVGSGFSISVREFVELAASIAESKSQLNFGGAPVLGKEIVDSKANIELLKELGWFPKVGVREGLMVTITDRYSERKRDNESKS